MNAAWQQENLREFCKEKGIYVSAWSPLGANGAVWGSLAVMDSPILKSIANTTGKTVAQVSFLPGISLLLFVDEKLLKRLLSCDNIQVINIIAMFVKIPPYKTKRKTCTHPCEI